MTDQSSCGQLFSISSAILCSIFTLPVSAQDVAGIDSLMDLCIPISATGASIRAGLPEAGWTKIDKVDAAEPLRNLVASQMWFLESASTPQQRLSLTSDYVNAFYASLGNSTLGPIFTFDDQVAMVLADDANISCIWAGPEDDALTDRINAVGDFPAADGTVTAARTQTVEAGGSDYTRIETYAFIAADERAGPLPFAARLDRSPVQ
ncbi:hypothetical protein [Cochlodiniinecator piscidefendens]|uniref:hypothetical protein n=1 Tax=Cochlodiniinecator piscidefendens TaxID=2715756 RepID=UPI00140826A9|nr:hypothetical protein [Cochlodiniinecator piscidefendens]